MKWKNTGSSGKTLGVAPLAAQHSTAHSLWRKFPREFQFTRVKPAKLSGEGQDFINNWPCSDVTTTLQKLL